MKLSKTQLIEVVVLLLNAPTDINKIRVKQLIDIYNETLETDTSQSNTGIRVLLYILNEILNDKFDLSNTQERMLLLSSINEQTIEIDASDSSDIDDESNAYGMDETKEAQEVTLLKNIFNDTSSLPDDYRRRIEQSVDNTIRIHIATNNIRRCFGKLRKASSCIDVDKQNEVICDIQKSLEKTSSELVEAASREVKTSFESVDMSDVESIKKALARNENRRTANTMKFGYQGINEMLGGGLGIGEMIVFAALSHHYKSGMLMDAARQLVKYNRPPIPNPDDSWTQGKPACLFISLENTVDDNLTNIINRAAISINKERASSMDIEQKAYFIHDYFKSTGYDLILKRFDNTFTVDDYMNLYQEMVDLGYNIVFSIVDYVNCMNHDIPSTRDLRTDLKIRATYEALRQHSIDRSTTFITAHQLNRKAEEVVARGEINVVKQFSSAMLSDSADVKRVTDCLIYLYIEKNHNELPFLTIQQGKRRGSENMNIPETHKYCAYGFSECGLPEDIMLDKPLYTRNIYAQTKSEGQASAFAATPASVF